MRRCSSILAVVFGASAAPGCLGRSALSLAADNPPPAVVAVMPIYPLHADWNDYIVNDDPSRDRFHQADVACAAAADHGPGGPDRCMHSGEARRFVIPWRTSCDGVTVTDGWSFATKPMYGVAYGNGVFVMVGTAGSSPFWIAASTAGVAPAVVKGCTSPVPCRTSSVLRCKAPRRRLA